MALIDLKETVDFWKNAFGFKPKAAPQPVASPIDTSYVIPNFITPAAQFTPIISTPKIEPAVDDFNPGDIISNSEFTNCDSMSEVQIQDFLVFKGSFLKDYKVNNKLTSYWISKHTKDNGLNPQVLITNIQKEQASITRKDIPKRQIKLDYFLGVGAYSNPISFNEKYRGIDNQIYGSVLVCMKRYNSSLQLQYPLFYKTDKPEFQKININNAATRSLYYYTPYSGDKDLIVDGIKYGAPFGNKFFWVIYKKWFSS